MTALPISVIVVSRGDPDSLRLCLTGLTQLFHTDYEIVVVADSAGLFVVSSLGLDDAVKTVRFEAPNAAQARNLGIAEAAGEVVAFLDADTVPEPTWLNHLGRAFRSADTVAAAGYVRGPDGYSWQMRACSTDTTGTLQPIDIAGDGAVLLSPLPGRAPAIPAANSALRRTVLADLGGFDPAIRTDLCFVDLALRLARLEHATAVVPLAQVQRLSDASVDPFEDAASAAALLRRHAPAEGHRDALSRRRAVHRSRWLTDMVAGDAEPGAVRRQMRAWARGRAAGRTRDLPPLPRMPHSARWFLPFDTRATGRAQLLAGPYRRRTRLRDEAVTAAAGGTCVTLLLMSRMRRTKSVQFTHEGVWEHLRGLRARDEAGRKLSRKAAIRRCLHEESTRLSPLRRLKP